MSRIQHKKESSLKLVKPDLTLEDQICSCQGDSNRPDILLNIQRLEEENRLLWRENDALRERNDSLNRSLEKVTKEEHQGKGIYKTDDKIIYSRLIHAFLANLSHEIRTPLNGIVGFSQLMISNCCSRDRIASYIDVIRASSDKLQNLIDDIIDLSRISSGEYKLSCTLTVVQNVFIMICESFRKTMEEKGICFRVMFDTRNETKMINIDPYLFERVLMHLLDNASKFTETGYVEANLTEVGPGEISFYVEDSGIGIEPGRQEEIFQEFRQGDFSDHRKFGGLGIGLTLIRDFVEFIGGSVAVDSAPDRGSRFSVRMPVCQL